MIVTHFRRRPFVHNFSIERVFSTVRQALPSWVDCRVAICRYHGTGPLKLAYNIVEAMMRQTGINHITGDTSYLAWLLRKKKTLLTIHDCGSMLHLKGWQRLLFRWCWLSIPVRRCALVTVISESTKLELIRNTGCLEEKIRIVPNPVGKEFRPLPKEFHAAMPVILQVGTRGNKNIGRVAAALSDISCELRIVGRLDPVDRLHLDQACVRYRVSHDLTDREMVKAYEECDLVIFASTYEGFGMPIIEANAVGRPVVTSNIEPMVSVAGGSACLVDPFDPESIRSGILRVIEDADYRQELVRRGFENAGRFSPEAIAEAYMAIYRELAPEAGDERSALAATEAVRPKILVFLATYLPGYKAGGPIRSIANLVEAFGDDFAFRIITSDRDLRSKSPYSGVPVREWVQVGKAEVMYLPPKCASIRAMVRIIRQTNPEVLYINSLFSPLYSIVPMLLRRIKLISPKTVLLAPRGELSKGALRLKMWKKFPFRKIARLVRLHKSVLWHASTEYEARDILGQFFGSDVAIAEPLPVHTACDLPDRPTSGPPVYVKKTAGCLRIAFLSRISPKKNLAGALSMLEGLRGDVLFSIYGPAEDAEYWKRCQKAMLRLSPNLHVEYQGDVPHDRVADCLAQNHLFFLPTLGENYGHVIAEALAAGCPILISDQTPWRNLEEKGVGWDLPLDSPERFRKVLQRMIDMETDEFQGFSSRARQYAMQHGSDNEIFRSNLELLDFAIRYPLLAAPPETKTHV